MLPEPVTRTPEAAFTMATALSEKTELSAEKKLLKDVFERENRPDGDYFIYSYDQRYYKVLSACAKLKLKTRNLPEGNPSYIEVRAEEWDRMMSGIAAPAVPVKTPPANDSKKQTAPIHAEITITEDEPDIERAVEQLAAHAAAAPQKRAERTVEKETIMPVDEIRATSPSRSETRPETRFEDPNSATYQSKLQALKSREQALFTREDAVRIREEAVQQREAAVAGAEEDLFASEQRLGLREKDLEAFSNDLESLRHELNEETDYLQNQRKQLLDLADHLRASAEGLLKDEG
jgi:hypothetical protein